jgi:O-antigen/teichoic acid export membrane protein
MFDISWFFQGLEEFGKIVLRNFIFKVINILFIFVFVKDRSDIYIYLFGVSLFPILGNLSLWLYLKRYIVSISIKSIKPFRNIKAILSLFVPTIAMQVYLVLDKTMIGIITKSDFENGYYEQAIKISKMVLTIVTALGTVMIPRIGFHFGKGDIEKVKQFMYRAYRFVWCLGIPLCFGLIGISNNFVPWFMGEDFLQSIPLINILSFLILAIGINNVTGMQYLIPTKRQNIFTLTVIIGAIVNFTLNIILIHFYQSIGAAIASITAETTIALVQLLLVRKELSISIIIKSSIHYLISGFVMLIMIKTIGQFLVSSILNTVVLVLIGGTLYISILILIKDDFLLENIKSISDKIRIKICNNNE